MRHVSLREFRTRGSKALQQVRTGETALLVGQNGPAYFLVPILGNVVQEDRELRRAMAKSSLREGWRLAESADDISDKEIGAEIAQARGSRRLRKAG